MKKRAAIFLNGTIKAGLDPTLYINDQTMVICADGGAVHAFNAGLTPDVLIGDMDSIPPQHLSKLKDTKTNIITYPRDKDYADGELSIRYALDERIFDIRIFAFKGSRFDHVLSNILFISKYAHKARFTLIDHGETFYFVTNKIVIKGNKGDTVSLISLSEECLGVKTEGLEYPLHDEPLSIGITRGVSNVLKGKEAKVGIDSGILLIIHNFN